MEVVVEVLVILVEQQVLGMEPLNSNNLHGSGGGGLSFIDESVFFASGTSEGIYPWSRTTSNGTSSYIVFGYPQQ
jgi:hypothetical protein